VLLITLFALTSRKLEAAAVNHRRKCKAKAIKGVQVRVLGELLRFSASVQAQEVCRHMADFECKQSTGVYPA